MTAVRVGTRGFMYRYKVPLSELQWVDTRVRFRWTMRKIYGNGMGRGRDPFSNVQRTASVEFLFTLLTPAHFVLVRHSSFEPSSYSSKSCFLGERLTRFSSPSVHSNRITFFSSPTVYIFLFIEKLEAMKGRDRPIEERNLEISKIPLKLANP